MCFAWEHANTDNHHSMKFFVVVKMTGLVTGRKLGISFTLANKKNIPLISEYDIIISVPL